MYNIEEKYIIGTVYGLADMAGNIFYVGSTYSPLNVRLGQHISEAKSRAYYGPARRGKKCDMIVRLKYKVQMVVLLQNKRQLVRME